MKFPVYSSIKPSFDDVSSVLGSNKKNDERIYVLDKPTPYDFHTQDTEMEYNHAKNGIPHNIKHANTPGCRTHSLGERRWKSAFNGH